MITLDKVTKIYKNGSNSVTALKSISLDIVEEEMIVILGHSGSGKSSLLNVISGLEPITNGKICYDDICVSDMDSKELTRFRKEYIGFIFQQYHLIPTLSVFNNIKMGANLSKEKTDINKIIEKTGLKGKENSLPHALSGGQQQRVSIARALAKNPRVLFCDEPTGALDSETSMQILKCLLEINKEFRTTVFIVTHNKEIAKLANRVIYMKDGFIISDEKQKPSMLSELVF